MGLALSKDELLHLHKVVFSDTEGSTILMRDSDDVAFVGRMEKRNTENSQILRKIEGALKCGKLEWH